MRDRRPTIVPIAPPTYPCARRNVVSNLLDLTRSLLASHEVKICMDFLEAIAASPLGQVEMSDSALKNYVQAFTNSQQQANGHSFAAINLLEQLVVESPWNAPAVPRTSAIQLNAARPSRVSEREVCEHRSSSVPTCIHLSLVQITEDADGNCGSCVESTLPSVEYHQSFEGELGCMDSQSVATSREVPEETKMCDSCPGVTSIDSRHNPVVVEHNMSLKSKTFCVLEAQVSRDHDLDSLTPEQELWLATRSDWFLLHPNLHFRICWDFVALLLIIAECITLPLNVCFAVGLDPIYQRCVQAFFACDLIMSFMTGYFHKQLLVMRRPMITMKYLRTWFMIDVICLLPWDSLILAISSQGDTGATTILRVLNFSNLLRIVRLTRVAKMGALFRRLQLQRLLSATFYEYQFAISCAKMFVIFGFLSHWGACIWNFIGSETTGDVTHKDCNKPGSCFVESPWMLRYGINTEDVFTNYIVAFHYVTVLICGGEAPVSPGTHAERIFTIIALMSAIFITSVVVGEILLIMEHQKRKTMAFDEKTMNARQFMVARKIPLPLQGRVYRFLEARQKSLIFADIDRKREFITLLSESLQIELVVQLNRRQLRRHPFFKLLEATSNSLKQICLVAKPYIYAGGDIVVNEMDAANSIIFLVVGKVQLTQKGGTSYVLVAPCWHSDRCLFSDDERRTHTLVAVNSAETLVLEKASMLEIFDGDRSAKSLYESYCERLRGSDLSTCRCSMCGERGHTISMCQHFERENELPSPSGFRDRIRQFRPGLSIGPALSAASSVCSGSWAFESRSPEEEGNTNMSGPSL